MKRTLFIVIGIIVLGLGIWWFATPSSDCQGDACNAQPISLPQQAVAAAEQGKGYLFDVRTTEEFNQGHAKEAVNFDIEIIKTGQYPEVPKNSDIYVYCRSGNRSAQATQILTDAGYTNVIDLGGLDEMRQAGVL